MSMETITFIAIFAVVLIAIAPLTDRGKRNKGDSSASSSSGGWFSGESDGDGGGGGDGGS